MALTSSLREGLATTHAEKAHAPSRIALTREPDKEQNFENASDTYLIFKVV